MDPPLSAVQISNKGDSRNYFNAVCSIYLKLEKPALCLGDKAS